MKKVMIILDEYESYILRIAFCRYLETKEPINNEPHDVLMSVFNNIERQISDQE